MIHLVPPDQRPPKAHANMSFALAVKFQFQQVQTNPQDPLTPEIVQVMGLTHQK